MGVRNWRFSVRSLAKRPGKFASCARQFPGKWSALSAGAWRRTLNCGMHPGKDLAADLLRFDPEAPRRRIPPWAGGVAALVLLAFGAWMALRRPPPPAVNATRFLIAPPQGYYLEGGGIRQSFALSPDGERIAFTAKDASGAFRLFLREFSEAGVPSGRRRRGSIFGRLDS